MVLYGGGRVAMFPMLPNNRVEPAHGVRSTRKRPSRLLAAHAGRWASQSNMSSESNHRLYQLPEPWGANCTPASAVVAVCRTASQLRLCRAPILRSKAVASSVVVPSLGAQLRSSSHRRGGAASSFAAYRCSVVRSESPRLLQARRCRSGGLPNKSLVPTPVTNVPLLSSSRGAAQLRRSAT
jgi:hypothetical protein